MRTSIPKCLLLPVESSGESLKPIIDYLCRLYPGHERQQIILCHFVAPLAPVYREKQPSPELAKKKAELLRARRRNAQAILEKWQDALLAAGYSAEQIQLHIQEKAASTAQHACQLADVKKVDAVLLRKRSASRLEAFLKGNPTDAVLHHCTFSPIWFIDGSPALSRVALCVANQEAALRAADHTAFMLAETEAEITLLHVAKSVSEAIECPAGKPSAALLQWLQTPEGRILQPFITECSGLLHQEGISEDRIRTAVIPGKSNTAAEILHYCRQQGMGTVILGHASGGGTWNFLKSSVTRNTLVDFKKMAVWVVQ